jgi:hypothetical protein
MSEFVSHGPLCEGIVQQRGRNHEDIATLCEPEKPVMLRLHSFFTQEAKPEGPALPLGSIGPMHLRGIEPPRCQDLVSYGLALRGRDAGIRRHDLQEFFLAQQAVGRRLTVGADGEQQPREDAR